MKNKMNETRRDIFDRMMRLSAFQRWEPLYLTHKEVLLYLFFGGLSFFVSIGTFSFCVYIIKESEIVGNIWSWVCAVLFAYITNRTWVFEDKAKGRKDIVREIYRFFAGRVFTLIIEELIIYIFITRLGFHAILIKVSAQIIVIILNYIISKVIVFRKKHDNITDDDMV